MRLITVPPPAIVVRCYGCGRRVNGEHETITADLDGPAYLAYYCPACAADMRARGK